MAVRPLLDNGFDMIQIRLEMFGAAPGVLGG
jgi:hypothetical protein